MPNGTTGKEVVDGYEQLFQSIDRGQEAVIVVEILMRILFITGRYGYGDPKRGDGYEYQNFLPALRRLGHEVDILESLLRSEYMDFVELNRAVLNKVESWKPDLVLYGQVHYEVWTETWDIIRKSGIAATINWASDDSWKYSQASRFIAKHFDACAAPICRTRLRNIIATATTE